jgi:predicted nuclease of predicted toxin-antitoxin system
MKVKVDEKIPVQVTAELRGAGHDVHTVAKEGLTSRPDREIWATARREGRFLITQDLDFSDIRQFRPGTHAGLLVLRLRAPGAIALAARYCSAFARFRQRRHSARKRIPEAFPGASTVDVQTPRTTFAV